MPAKSNKFDYSNRSSEGAKLGQIIRGALEKEAEKILKDGEKYSQKARKPSTTACEEYTHTTHLDIRAPGRQLTDEGVSELARGLEATLTRGTEKINLALEDLNLSSNAITSASLQQIAPSIVLARNTLRTLDLSHNNIKVETEDEAEEWAAFLHALDKCAAFQRLDLTGNQQLSAKAIEILCELYIKSAKDVTPINASQGVEGKPEADNDDRPVSRDSMSTSPSLETAPLDDQQQRSGLRSIPYVILDDTALSDAGAMWLSYILERHYFPCQLLGGLSRPTSQTQHEAEEQGISWQKNDSTLGKDGRHVLRQASEIREQLLIDASSLSYFEAQASDQLVQSRTRVRGRGVSQGNSDGQEEFRSTIRKVQRSIIVANGGPCRIDLWRATLRVVTLSRAFATTIGVGKEHIRRPRDERNAVGSIKTDDSECRSKQTQTADPHQSETRKELHDSAHNSPERKITKHQKTYFKLNLLAKDSLSAGPETAVTSANITPPRTKDLLGPSRKNAFSEGSDAVACLAERLDDLQVQGSHRFVAAQHERNVHEALQIKLPEPFRHEAVPSHLPPTLMKNIIRTLLTKRESEAMTNEQFEKAFAWGQDRGSLTKELEWSKDHFSIQIMKLLEAVNCLEFMREESAAAADTSDIP